jgi:ABC-2 type transport system ATP-binding protein
MARRRANLTRFAVNLPHTHHRVEDEEEMMASELLIDVRDLAKHYGSIRAVDGISFQVRRGDVLGFLGPNGAGKTTAMRMITGFIEPDRGSVSVAGFDIANSSLEARRRIGYLAENAPSYGEMTVSGFLEFIAAAREVDDGRAAIARVVAMTGLSQVKHQTIDTLSKGYKRRVGLAQALIHDPEVLILDEPTDGLDPNQKALVQELISTLAHDKAIVLSTHILDEAEKVCNRAVIISEGRLLTDSTPEALVARAPSHNVIRVTVDDPSDELVATIAEQPWCEAVERSGEAGINIVPADGENHLPELLPLLEDQTIHSVHLQEGRFDELFRNMTQGVSA